MKIAYIILAHKLPGQLVRLVNKLNSDNTRFFIHVDKKVGKETYQEMEESLRVHENVHFLNRRVVRWGTYSQVQVALDGIQEALTLKFEFDYLILLTGQDYPIKSNEYIRKFLEESNGKSYLEYFPLPADIWKRENGGMDRIDHWHFYFLGRPRKVFPRFDSLYRKFIGNFKVFGGSAYWCLARDCAEYLNECFQNDGDIIKFWKYTRIPDELFFQTTLLNSHLKDQIINDNVRYIVWISTPHPEVLTKHYFEQAVSSGKLFARKFDGRVDSEILDMIDAATS